MRAPIPNGRRLLSALAPLLLASLAAGQITREGLGPIIVPQHVLPPPPPPIMGGPGDDVLIGTSGRDEIYDDYPGDTDTLRDAPPGTTDGRRDRLDARDGDGNDHLFGGPEDEFLGDPGDHVCILTDGEGGPGVLWCGTYREYARIRGLLRWAQDGLQALLQMLDGGPPPDGFWQDAIGLAIEDVLLLAPDFGDGAIPFADACDLGPYVFGPLDETQPPVTRWCPFAGLEDPCVATQDLTWTADEFAEARTVVVALLQHALAPVPD
jgi:hypothetical protein